MTEKEELIGRIKYKLDIMIKYVIFMFVWVISAFFSNKKKYRDLWIVSERGDDAGDNGYAFFSYMRRKHPECNVKYIIKTNAPDAVKVGKIGTIIPYGSLEHYLSIILAKVLISSHILGYTTNDYLFKKFERRGMLKGKRVFLQHGITKDDTLQLYRNETSPDIFVCAVKKEADYVKSRFGHPDSVVRLVGLCRYDNLPLHAYERKTKRLLLMPTWRQELYFYSKRDFCGTSYYKNWQALLSSKKFIDLLKKYDYQAVFYPHHQMQKFVSAFTSVSDRVIVASSKDYEVQKLLIDSDVLITDFSSVFFDYAYMQKPLIYFQFDKQEFRKKHYRQGWFSYEKDGFGKVLESVEDVLTELGEILDRGSTMESLYLERCSEVFEFNDSCNCERNYKAIQELLDADRRQI